MVLLHPFFFLISLILPRDKRVWVFGCYDGYIDNTKYFFEYASRQNQFECYWLANNEKELATLRSAGHKGVLKKSLRGYWYASRASFTFICTGFSDVNRLFALNSNVINFWHGTPIKKVYLDSMHDLHRFGTGDFAVKSARALMTFLTSRIKIYYASNEFERKLVSKAAAITPERGVALGTPRYDEIRKMAENDVFKNLRNKYQKFILYAPTWRERGHWQDEFKINAEEYTALNFRLEQLNAALVIKPHPLTKTEELYSIGLKASDRILYTGDLGIKDINAIYPHIDLLITDISSSMYDVLIFKKPVILFMPDLPYYMTGDRGIYDYFKDSLKKYALTDWKQLGMRLYEKEQTIPILHEIEQEVGDKVNVCAAIYGDIKRRFYSEERV